MNDRKTATWVMDQDDINTELHPNMWKEMCEELDAINPDGSIPTTITVRVELRDFA